MTEIAPDVLLIEDNRVDVELSLEALKRCAPSVSVQVFPDGAQALEFLHRTGSFAKRSSEEPKLIILDLKLPMVDGHYVLRQIASDPIAKNIPIVIMSSSREPRDIFSTYKLGINSYVVKPVNSDAFLEAVENIARYWLKTNQPPLP